VEDEKLDAARAIEADAGRRGIQLALPIDHVVVDRLEAGAASEVLKIDDPAIGQRLGVDIGPATIDLFAGLIGDAKTVVWNGPMGVFEIDAYARGTLAMAHAIADAYALTIVGGGETALAVHRSGESENMSFISTGGGAALELLEGKQLPGLTALPNRIT